MRTGDDLSILREKKLMEAVSRFENLLNRSGRAFLIGAGCSKCAGLPLTAELTDSVLASAELKETSREILQGVQNLFTGASSAHIEDYLSELIDSLAIAARREARGAERQQVEIGGRLYTAAELRAAADQIKRAIAGIIERKVSIEVHRAFVAAVHRPLRQGKLVPGHVVDYLVLNYDTALEEALALERVKFADGIDGGVTGWWNPHTFDGGDLAARVFKLHGSIDWCEFESDPLPRRISRSVNVASESDRRVLIWPASTKYRETQLDPYAQLMDWARRVLRPLDGSQRVLVICGYGFGDAHINLEIERGLRESAGNLTVVAFTSEDEPTGPLKQWTEDREVREQVLVFAKRGFFHGDLSESTETELPWWKFEIIAGLLGGER